MTFDGQQLWVAVKDRLTALDPDSGSVVRTLEVAADAGTAFDGKHLWQLAGGRVHKIESRDGPSARDLHAGDRRCPLGHGLGGGDALGRELCGREIHQIDAETGA